MLVGFCPTLRVTGTGLTIPSLQYGSRDRQEASVAGGVQPNVPTHQPNKRNSCADSGSHL